MTGLLLSYRFSSALSKWDEGKQIWVGVRTNIRDGVRMVSVCYLGGDVVLSEKLSITSTTSSSPALTSTTPYDFGEISPNSLSNDSSPSKAAPIPIPMTLAASPAKIPLSLNGLSGSPPDKPADGLGQSPPHRKMSDGSRKGKERSVGAERSDELAGLIVGFAFALQ